MKKHVVIILLIILSVPLMADDFDPCEDYYFSRILHGDHTLSYSMVGWQDIEEPYVDSVWITTVVDKTTIILVSHIQPREKIDISFLPRGQYLFWVQVGACKQGRLFSPHNGGVHTPVTEIQCNVEELSNPDKFFHNGQLLILRDGKTYSVTGQEVAQ